MTGIETAVAPSEERLSTENLRVRAARGTVVNSAFQIGLAVLNLLKRVAVAAFLTREEFGVWGIILTVLITLVWLKQIGIFDKFVQQTEPDQELAFQKAFTLEVLMSIAYFVLCCIVLPLYALGYGYHDILLPGLVMASSVLLTALQAPAWIPYREMHYARQRLLTSVDPIVSAVGMIGLAAAGFGVWGVAIGWLIGSAAGALVCVMTSPYPLRLRFDRATAREYVRFSWPLLGLAMSQLVVIQGTVVVANQAVGLAGLGAIGLATSYAAFTDRVDGIVSQTIYPAVCRVADKRERLAEVFVKSNRVALMWAMPFGAGLALFGGDLVHYLLGDEWESAVGLFGAIGVLCACGQVAFNWSVFMRATNRTRPMFVASIVELAVFVVVSIPATLALGLTGYAIGFGIAMAAQIVVRTYFMRALVPGFDALRQLLHAIAPVVPAVGVVLLIRLLAGGDRSPLRALAELAVFALACAATTYLFERKLITELSGYVRGRMPPPAPSASAAAEA
jgi:O-antigen/teichoic acid export membrane protein